MNARPGQQLPSLSFALFVLGIVFLFWVDALGKVQAQQVSMDTINDIVKPVSEAMEPYKVSSSKVARGVPMLHDNLNCDNTPQDQQCQHETFKDSPMVGAGHHVRAQTNTPIIGILMQPIPDAEQWQAEFNRLKKHIEQTKLAEMLEDGTSESLDIFPHKKFIEQTHVQFLEAAGARVVPVDYNLAREAMKQTLEKLNGVYIPGDSLPLLKNTRGVGFYDYTEAVQRILEFAQNLNEDNENHFPILGVGYGMLSMMRSQTQELENFQAFQPQNKLQMNLAHKPEHTFLFDSYSHTTLEDTLDRIKFFSSPLVAMTMNDFILKEPTLSQIFVPVCSFHNDTQGNSNHEFVAAIEGVVYPWFGVAYRVDKIQFGMDINDQIDHSREAVIHAQKLANLFVDEARLSPHEYGFVSDEVKAIDLIAENDLFSVQVPLWEGSSALVRTEVYLF